MCNSFSFPVYNGCVGSEDTGGKRRGPVPGPEKARTNVLIEPDLLEWGKHQPGGFSELVRRLVREAKEKQEQARE